MGSRISIIRSLCVKGWRESQGRFVLSAASIASLLAVFLLFQGSFRAHLGASESLEQTYIGYTYLRVYGGFVRGTFTVLALVLGLGGLQRERALHTVGFSLALPVSRVELVLGRALVGMAQVVALALLPVALVPTFSRVARQAYPFSQALAFGGLWIVIGWALFAFAMLVSSVIRSEYAALTVSIVAYFTYPLVVVYAPFLHNLPLHVHYIMNGRGMSYVDDATGFFVGPWPWGIGAGAVAVTLALFAVAAAATLREDFA